MSNSSSDNEYEKDLDEFMARSKIAFPMNPYVMQELEKVELYKEIGNKLLKNKQQNKSLDIYDECMNKLNKIFENEQNDDCIIKGNTIQKNINLNKSLIYIKLKNYTKALEKNNDVLNNYENDVKALQRCGYCYNRLQKWNKAKECLKKAKKQFKNDDKIDYEIEFNIKKGCIYLELIKLTKNEFIDQCNKINQNLNDINETNKEVLINNMINNNLIQDNFKTEDDVNNLLLNLGVKKLNNVSKCLRASIFNGYIKLNDGLNTIIKETGCELCGNKLQCRIKDVLQQPDYAGTDQEECSENATFICNNKNDNNEYCECRTQITEICNGNFTLDSGKFHNHYNICENFGECMGDQRMTHCNKCGEHQWCGLLGYKCDNCKKNKLNKIE